jgi:hypothetical protein
MDALSVLQTAQHLVDERVVKLEPRKVGATVLRKVGWSADTWGDEKGQPVVAMLADQKAEGMVDYWAVGWVEY